MLACTGVQLCRDMQMIHKGQYYRQQQMMYRGQLNILRQFVLYLQVQRCSNSILWVHGRSCGTVILFVAGSQAVSLPVFLYLKGYCFFLRPESCKRSTFPQCLSKRKTDSLIQPAIVPNTASVVVPMAVDVPGHTQSHDVKMIPATRWTYIKLWTVRAETWPAG